MPLKPSVSESPEVLWIELTSKCPFKCVFCSRELLHGSGEHMDISLYRRLISELITPQIIRLNYSGESVHYPHIIEAIELAKQKGARVELVSAFSSIKPKLIEPLVRSGLDLLCVSIHSIEPDGYRDIYGFGSSESLLQRLAQLRETQAEIGVSTPALEFALVAMERNLEEISAVMELAESLDVSRLDIHPVIRRDPITETFPRELDISNRLRPDFIKRLSDHVDKSKRTHPGVCTGFSTPEIRKTGDVLGEIPTAWPAQLPRGASILSCEQNPWNTVHVLSSGDVVTCEVRDQQVMGNLTQTSLKSIWHGGNYQEFRRQYVRGGVSKCNTCAYKIAYQSAHVAKASDSVQKYADQPLNKLLRLAKISIAHMATATLKLSLAVAQGSGTLAKQFWPVNKGIHAKKKVDEQGSGISVIIPERDSPELLKQCLHSLYQAIALCDCEYEVIIIVNGTGQDIYTALENEFPSLKWHFEKKWLGFADAIQRGLRTARHDWVFLINTDMQLEPDSLHEIYRRRAGHIFALACQIFMSDKTKRREETGFTGLNPKRGLQGLYDGSPYIESLPSTHIYAGGGASLFQKNLLSKLIEPLGLYEPFYWEDFDWGVRAQQLGYQVLFVPQAMAHHQHRATVSRFFSEQQIRQMFECNALLTGLCFGWYQPSFTELSSKLAQFRSRVFRPSRLQGMMRKRFDTGRALSKLRLSDEEVVCYYPREPIPGDQRPWLLLVSPYLVYPLVHGGAVRIDGVSRALAKHYRLVLVCDEGWSFDPTHAENLDQYEAVHLLLKPRASTAANRLARMKGHATPLLCQEVVRALSVYRPSIVQIEYEELCDLVKFKQHERWFITLHDVNRGESRADAYLDRRLRHFEGVFCCSVEDQGMLPLKSHLVENGTSLAQFTRYEPSSGQTLLFTGPFRYKPNRIGMEMFAREVFPDLIKQFPRLELKVLCGDEGLQYSFRAPFRHPRIKLLPHSTTVYQHLETATMTINPLRDIAGSCLKTIESLAANRVCVSTPDATRGLNHLGFSGLLTARTPEQFVRTITSLLQDEPLRHRLEESPPGSIQEFDWSNRAESQMVVYEV
ncbi:MAG: glycosyltransferase [Desulfuromusa sp.]|nr:glycosyltransferase [Desulfuromusa sp.]